MSDDKQFQSAAVEGAAAGKGGLSQEELDELVASSDTGGRSPAGVVGTFIVLLALAWSLFQLWIASPFALMIPAFSLNSTEERAFHLAFALVLAFLAYPSSRTPFQLGLGVAVPVVLSFLFWMGSDTSGWWIFLIGAAVVACVLLGSPKNWVPPWEWAMAIAGAASALYIYVAYDQISGRVGAPITQDLVISVIGLMLLLEATSAGA